MTQLVESYLKSLTTAPDTSALAFYASIDTVSRTDPLVANAILKELLDQEESLKLIASENYCSLAVQQAMGNLLTDKYAEGYPFHRFYAGCENVDTIEAEAADLACQLFGADHAFVQPHSGADANLVAFLSILTYKTQKPILEEFAEKNISHLAREDWNKVRSHFLNQKLLALDYYSGGHLTHGYRHNVSSMLFDVHQYTVDKDSKLLDPEQIRKQLHEVKPLIFLVGYSAYPRKINFKQMREMADEVGAVLMADIAHFAGLVAGGVFADEYNPVPYAHIVTSTTHKTLRGPRGGLVLCQKEFAETVDKACPIVLGGPLPHVMAAKAVAFREALKPEFKDYAHGIVQNAQALAKALQDEGLTILTGGTDNHLMLLDVGPLGLTGRQAEAAIRECGITLNRNALPFDVNGPWYTSGLRLGASAVTTRGMTPIDMVVVAKVIKDVLMHMKPQPDSKAKYTLPDDVRQRSIATIRALTQKHPIYPALDLGLVRRNLDNASV